MSSQCSIKGEYIHIYLKYLNKITYLGEAGFSSYTLNKTYSSKSNQEVEMRKQLFSHRPIVKEITKWEIMPLFSLVVLFVETSHFYKNRL